MTDGVIKPNNVDTSVEVHVVKAESNKNVNDTYAKGDKKTEILVDEKAVSDLVKFTDDEKNQVIDGATLDLDMSVAKADGTTGDSSIATAISSIAAELKKETNTENVDYIDANLSYKIKANNEESYGESKAITETNEPMTISVPVSSELKGKTNYVVYRYHEGEVDKLPATYDKESGMLTFETDRFSVYALAADSEVSGAATKYDTIITKEFEAGKSKKGITISMPNGESGTNLNGIVTVNANLKVTMLDSEWTPTGYVLSRVTPDNNAATNWISIIDNKVEQKNFKKYATVKYNKKNKQTLISLKQNKNITGGVYAIRLEDGKRNTIYMNVENIELSKDIKKNALKLSTVEAAPTVETMLATADGDTAKTIGFTMLGSKIQSEFNSNVITWVVGSGKNSLTLKKDEIKAVADKSGKAIAYLTVDDNGTVKVVSGTVKGKVKLAGIVNGKAYKTTVIVK